MCVCVCVCVFESMCRRGCVILFSHYSLLFMIHGEYAFLHDSLSSSKKELRSVCFSPELAFSLVSKCTEEVATNVIVIDRGRMRG